MANSSRTIICSKARSRKHSPGIHIQLTALQVELAAKAGALRQMLLELLEHPQDIRKMTIMGRTCNIRKADGSIECTVPLDKQSAEGVCHFDEGIYCSLSGG